MTLAVQQSFYACNITAKKYNINITAFTYRSSRRKCSETNQETCALRHDILAAISSIAKYINDR